MNNWIAANGVAVFSLLAAALVGVVGWLIRLERRDAQMDQRQKTVENEVADGKKSDHSVRNALQAHVVDTRRHVDPERDKEWRDGVIETMRRIEEKIDDLRNKD